MGSTGSRFLALGVVALSGLGLAACTTVPPRAADRAEEECRAEARAEGFREISAEASSTGIGDTVLVNMNARRDGQDYTGSCTYDRSTRRVRLSMSRVGEADGERFARAREACREEAVDRGYEVRGTSDVRRVGDTIRMTLDLRRRGRSYEGYCRYADRRADLEIR
ncbi:MAG: hypothetical protein NZ555_02110 [Geminicoccaceae bacterium]|nr:hypothetical protein [Geminicoccaceae bacterium]MDW8370329.1 hypothetical protein [Geminicoccaceae bacterium]